MYNDRVDFDQDGIKNVIFILTDTRATMEQIKQELIEYNDQNLKPHWITAGSIVAQSRLTGFIEGNITDFIDYIQKRIEDLEAVLTPVDQIDNA